MVRICFRPYIAQAITEATIMFCDVISYSHSLISVAVAGAGTGTTKNSQEAQEFTCETPLHHVDLVPT